MPAVSIVRGYLYHPSTDALWGVLEGLFGPGKRKIGPFRDRWSLETPGLEVRAETSDLYLPNGHEVYIAVPLGESDGERLAAALIAAVDAIGGLYVLDRYDEEHLGPVLEEYGEIESPDFVDRFNTMRAQTLSTPR